MVREVKTGLKTYLEIKQYLWDIIEVKNFKNLDGKTVTLFWGRREPDDFAKALCPEIQFISDVQTGGKPISDQATFYFPKDNRFIIRVMDESIIDKKTAESSVIDLAQQISDFLEGEGEFGDTIIDPGIMEIRSDEIEGERSHYFASDLVFACSARV